MAELPVLTASFNGRKVDLDWKNAGLSNEWEMGRPLGNALPEEGASRPELHEMLATLLVSDPNDYLDRMLMKGTGEYKRMLTVTQSDPDFQSFAGHEQIYELLTGEHDSRLHFGTVKFGQAQDNVTLHILHDQDSGSALIVGNAPIDEDLRRQLMEQRGVTYLNADEKGEDPAWKRLEEMIHEGALRVVGEKSLEELRQEHRVSPDAIYDSGEGSKGPDENQIKGFVRDGLKDYLQHAFLLVNPAKDEFRREMQQVNLTDLLTQTDLTTPKGAVLFVGPDLQESFAARFERPEADAPPLSFASRLGRRDHGQSLPGQS